LNSDFPRSRDEIIARIFEAGVVGAGGAGFPTHVKAAARADVVIANGCECEPLLQTDRYVLESMAKTVVDGLLVMMLATGASRGRIALREGFPGVEDTLKKSVEGARGVDVVTVADNYPAGDEHILVYEATGRVIPQGGIPPDVGIVVSNVNTLVNVRQAMDGIPVTSRFVSVCGDVDNPCLVEAPVGTSVRDVLELTGNAGEIEAKGVLLSGVMMGQYCEDLSTPIDKRMGSVVVIPGDSELRTRKSLSTETMIRRAASVCCQCRLCTDLCTRHLMGHSIEPHRVMRAIAWGRSYIPDLSGALFCSGCGLCGVYVCPMGLSPDRISSMVRAEMGERGVKAEDQPEAVVTPLRAGRLVPHHRILERTGLAPFERDLEFAGALKPGSVRIPLAQHAGKPARPVVEEGATVAEGQLIGDAEAGGISARVHASISGVVTSVDGRVGIERR
jgi:Na+-translocating ferredoxin:NAD+ oxidoreductase RnfC subunit